MKKTKRNYTLMGLLATLIWGTGSAFGRSLSETYGVYSSSGLTNLGAGILSTAVQLKKTGLRSYRKAPPRYWLVCGTLYVVYKLTTSIAVGVAATREQVITSGLLRQMWPLMTLLVTLVMFRRENKVSRWLPVGVGVCFAGLLIANAQGGSFSLWGTLRAMFVDAFWPSLLSIISSVAWGMYSGFHRKIVGEEDYDAAGLFMIITGVLSYSVTLFVAEPRQFAMQQMAEVVYMVVFSSFLATMFWNLAMQKGNHMFVIYVANFLPVFSTITSAVLLGVKLTVPVVVGSLMVVAGTIFSKACIKQRAKAATDAR